MKQRDLFNGYARIDEIVDMLIEELSKLSEHEKIIMLNNIRKTLHAISPFKNEPVDLIQWVEVDSVRGNDYNPNKVAPPEMELLRHSINHDGYTQPIVTWQNNDGREVVDGFHRLRVAQECPDVIKRINNMVPVVTINDECIDRNDRIASTIRHNRARGKHVVDSMKDIVVELKNRNWSNDRIGRELGMDPDEILRLCQITGLAELFSDQEFSKAWDVEGEITELDYSELSDDVNTYGNETSGFRTVNTNDESRIFHKYDKWECYKAGFYKTSFDGMTKEECEKSYANFLSDESRFAEALEHVISEWKYSCEHYLTNSAMNRIAWLGQAAMCYATGIPAAFRSGYHLLSKEQKIKADNIALIYLNKWLIKNGRPQITLDEAYSYDRQSDIY